MTTNPQSLDYEVGSYGIRHIEVRGLFGRFNYDLHIPTASTAELSRVLVLYGDNGSGKTTLLRLLFHLLSPAPRRGHRTFLARTPFQSFEVAFSTGFTVRARRETSTDGTYELELARAGDTFATVTVEVNEEGTVPPTEAPELDVFTSRLYQEHQLDLYYLGDDRRLETDSMVRRGRNIDNDDDDELVQILDPIRGPRLIRRERGPVTDLLLAIDRATSAIRQEVLGASNVGGESTNAIYTEVLRRIAHAQFLDTAGKQASKQELTQRLTGLATRSDTFQKFGLVPALRPDPIEESIDIVPDERWDVLEGVLTPFLDGLEARLEALAGIADSLSTFVDNLNAFYHDKRVTFTLQRGISVETLNGEDLPPHALSSGERHLLLVLTNLLYARERPGLFIIDEPEISLNMKWQRKLIEALLDCTRGSGTLFVLASHSFELISAADERVIHLSHPLPQRLPLG